jgi:hypothetical protein
MSTYHKGEKISDYYKLEDELGRYYKYNYCPLSYLMIIYRGSFAIVKSAVNKKTGEKVAIKIIAR